MSDQSDVDRELQEVEVKLNERSDRLAELQRENERLHKNIDINLELLEKAEAALAAEREFLWNLCPHTDKYGDAGEMQCHGLDFRRSTNAECRAHTLKAIQEIAAAERAQRESLEKLLLDIADDATDGPINRGLNSVQAVLAWTAAAPQESEPTPSVKRCDCPVHDCQHHRGLIPYPAAGSEQPDLPLGHEFEPCPSLLPDGFPARFCVLKSPKQTECHFWHLHPAHYCGQPESAHRGKQ